MNLIFSRIVLFLSLGALGAPSLVAGGTPASQVVVVGDITKLGKMARVPDAAHPVYYVPLTPDQPKAGTAPTNVKPPAKTEGKQPTKAEVLDRLGPALAKRHFLPAGLGHPPEIVLSFWWGTADPEIENYGTDDALEEDSFNQRAMIALVGSDKKQELGNWHSKDLRSAERQERHYLVVMAFDYAAAVQKQKKILWITRTSLPASDTDLAGAIEPLVLTAGPAFGREALPAWIKSDKVKDESVIIAPFEVKETVPEQKK
jgi:hypothetical protein